MPCQLFHSVRSSKNGDINADVSIKALIPMTNNPVIESKTMTLPAPLADDKHGTIQSVTTIFKQAGKLQMSLDC